MYNVDTAMNLFDQFARERTGSIKDFVTKAFIQDNRENGGGGGEGVTMLKLFRNYGMLKLW
jgi:hypothetical protein